MVSANALSEFEKNDVELSVPSGEPRPILIVVMGPASCGKSTIGEAVAKGLSIPFYDGDSLHPASNIAKMSAGIPLNDDDRLPWLALIRSTAERVCKEQWESGQVKSREEGGVGRAAVVIACSALRKWYRDILRGDVDAIPPPKSDLPPSHDMATAEHKAHRPATANLQTLFLYCHGTPEVLAARIAARKNHFMGAKMLESQLKTLEDPRGEDGVCSVEIDQTEEKVGSDAVKTVKELVESAVGGQ